jgi:hypothetical protein
VTKLLINGLLILVLLGFVTPEVNSADIPCEKLVVAGWFPWYGNPAHDSVWSRWNDTGHIPEINDIMAMFWPKLGLYSGRDPFVLAQQAEWIKQSGANIVVIFWNDVYQGEQERMEEAMRVFGSLGLKGFIAIDANWFNPNFEDVIQRLETAIGWYARYSTDYYNNFYYRDPCTGYPVFMVYDPGQTGTVTQWNDKIAWYKNNTPEHGIFIAGGGINTPVEWMKYSLFDGYSWTGAADGDSDQSDHEYILWKLHTQNSDHPFYMGGLIAGFDTRANCHDPSPIVVDRQGGDVFISKWKGIINAGWNGYEINWVYVPFNDYGEGAGIEPITNTPPQRGSGYESCGGRVPQFYTTYLPRSETFYLTINQKCTNEFLKIQGYICEILSPFPDIKANGSDGLVNITHGDPLSVTIALNPGDMAGKDADWWVVADTPMGWYHYDVGSNSWEPDITVTYQRPLFNLSSYEVLNTIAGPQVLVEDTQGLSTGTYTFYFAVDMIMNGVIDYSDIYWDSVEVNITP